MTNCTLHKNYRPFLNNIIKIGFVVNPIDIVKICYVLLNDILCSWSSLHIEKASYQI